MDITTTDLVAELEPGSKLLELLREIARFRGPGAVVRDLPGCDTEPVYALQDLGMVTVGLEYLGTIGMGGDEAMGQVAHVTEHGLEELVVHGHER